MGSLKRVNVTNMSQTNSNRYMKLNSSDSDDTNATDRSDFQRQTSTTAPKNSSSSGCSPSKHHYTLVSSPSLPKFLSDNEFLLHNHRPELPTVQACARSMCHLHTETVNIWSHLLGSSFMLLLTVYYMLLPASLVSWSQKAWFLPFFLGSIICMGFSTVFHSFNCYSEKVFHTLAKLDYCGIIILIVASFPPWLHYGFYCDNTTKVCYLLLIVCLGLLSVLAVMSDKFAKPEFRAVRAALFMALGLSGLIPGLHYFYLVGAWHTLNYGSWLLIMAGWYLLGGFMYAIRVPERLRPGWFDIVCQSHQILHICVILGVMTCYIGLVRLAAFRLAEDQPCPVS